MRKECRDCRTVNHTGAPFCDACGCYFDPVLEPTPRAMGWYGKRGTWKGRLIAAGSGLLVAGVVQLFGH